MSNLNYQKSEITEPLLISNIYHVESMYHFPDLYKAFIQLKANIVDLNPALITKCIQGTEQDYIMLMNKAKEFLKTNKMVNDAGNSILMDLFSECVFGYYVLTPLINEKTISDIKVLAWDHITVKMNGDRYLTDLSFFSEEDYNRWYERILRIHRLHRGEEDALQHCTDRKGVNDFLLRIDIQLSYITSTEANNIHIRKQPKKKLNWDYLKEYKMLDNPMLDFIRDRITNNYSFLISGKGGSGKSTLLNNMIDVIPFDQSILVSQESDELYSDIHPQIQFEHTLQVRKNEIKTEFSLEDELRLGLLQDIDNFIIGEIKGGEALYVFTTGMSTGARFFGTIHSNDCRGSVRRLAHCARYVSNYPMETLEEMLTSTPFCLIHLSRFSIDEILEIDGWDYTEQRLIFHEVYKKKQGVL